MTRHPSSPSTHPSQIISGLDIAQLVLSSFKGLDDETRQFTFRSNNTERTAVTRFAVQILIDVARECNKAPHSAQLVASGTFRGSNSDASQNLKELVTHELAKVNVDFNNDESEQGVDYVIRTLGNQFDTCFAMESEGRAFGEGNDVSKDFDKLLREQSTTRVFVCRVNSCSNGKRVESLFASCKKAISRARSATLNNPLLANTYLLIVALIIGKKAEDHLVLCSIRFNADGNADEPKLRIFDASGNEPAEADAVSLQEEVSAALDRLVADGTVEKVTGTDGEVCYRLK